MTIDAIKDLKDNWDGNGSIAPLEYSIKNAEEFLEYLEDMDNDFSHFFRNPHMSCSEYGIVTFEWFRPLNKLTIYFGEEISYIKVYGTDIVTEMEEGICGDFSKLAYWLDSHYKDILLKDLKEIESLQPDWDGYGALAIPAEVNRQSRIFVYNHQKSQSYKDLTCWPNPNGTISFEWDDKKCHMEIGISKFSFFKLKDEKIVIQIQADNEYSYMAFH